MRANPTTALLRFADLLERAPFGAPFQLERPEVTLTMWEQVTLELIGKLEQEKLVKAEERLATSQRGVEVVREQIRALYMALDIYRSEHGLPRLTAAQLDPREVERYHGLVPREMLERWAEEHDGLVVMKDAAAFLSAAGFFRDMTQATGTLYPTVRRAEFDKVGRGVYRQRKHMRLVAESTGEAP